jgi:hypothetical protein
MLRWRVEDAAAGTASGTQSALGLVLGRVGESLLESALLRRRWVLRGLGLGVVCVLDGVLAARLRLGCATLVLVCMQAYKPRAGWHSGQLTLADPNTIVRCSSSSGGGLMSILAGSMAAKSCFNWGSLFSFIAARSTTT